eukprot:511542-Amphidinium_carterae.1
MRLRQVIPDVKEPPQKCGADAATKSGMEQRLADMLAQHEVSIPEEKVRLAANYYVLKGLDHCLQVSFNKGLVSFVPDRILRPLQGQQRRYTLPREKCEAKCRLGQDQRLCVWDPETSKSWYEITPNPPACLHIVSDQGPMGWPGLHFMSAHLDLCCSYRWDESHRMWNDTKLSVSRSGLDMIRIAATAVYNTASGPYGTGAWQNDISWAAEQLVSHAGTDHPLFVMHFDEIAKEVHSFATWGTEEHQADVWKKF